MNLIEVPKLEKDLCIKAFKENILKNFDLETLSKLASTGLLGSKYLRSIGWKIFFVILSQNDSLDKWKEKLSFLRMQYKIISDKVKKQQNFIEEEEKKKGSYNFDIKTDILKQNSSVFNPFRPEKESKKLIDLDLNRTFQDFSLFRDDVIKKRLGHILYVWSVENSKIRYQQGMNDILSIIFLALYPYYFKKELEMTNSINDNDNDNDEARELYLYFNDEDELDSDLYICFEAAMNKGIKQFYEFEFDSGDEQDKYIKKICIFQKELENVININDELYSPLIVRCSSLVHEKLKVLDKDLYSHFNNIGVNCVFFYSVGLNAYLMENLIIKMFY